MPRRTARPPVKPIVIGSVLVWVVLCAVVAGGILTALIVIAFHPAMALWIAALIALTTIVGLSDMRQTLPDWFRWFRGRPPRK